MGSAMSHHGCVQNATPGWRAGEGGQAGGRTKRRGGAEGWRGGTLRSVLDEVILL